MWAHRYCAICDSTDKNNWCCYRYAITVSRYLGYPPPARRKQRRKQYRRKIMKVLRARFVKPDPKPRPQRNRRRGGKIKPIYRR